MIIDFHTHVFPDNLYKKAISGMEEMSGMKAFGEGSEAGLAHELKNGTINRAVVLPVATKAAQVETINRYNITKKYDNIYFLGAMHPDYTNFEGELKFLNDNGIRGIKMHPEFQGFFASDKKFYPLYETLVSLDMFVVFHSGYEEFVKHEIECSTPSIFAKVHDDFPDLKMVLAHCGGHSEFEIVREHICGKNIYVDLAFDLAGSISEKDLKELLNTHSEDFILYGSDYPWQPLNEYYKYFDRFNVESSKRDKIEYKNALKLLKIDS